MAAAPNTRKVTPVIAATVTTVSSFVDEVMKYASGEPRFKCYRGQKNSDWENIPGLLRPNLLDLSKNEKRAIRDLISVHPNEFSNDHSMFDRLVRMQHFGLPTRLMDVSLNPLVALYFATEGDDDTDGSVAAFAVPEGREKYYDSDAVSCIANLCNMTSEEKDTIIDLRASRIKGTPKENDIRSANETNEYKRLHQFIRVEKPYFLPIIDPIDLFKPYYVHPKMSNRRIIAQSGGFIIHGLQPKKRINFAHVIQETRFIIPKKEKTNIRGALAQLGITESSLFPELDKAADRIKAYYGTSRTA